MQWWLGLLHFGHDYIAISTDLPKGVHTTRMQCLAKQNEVWSQAKARWSEVSLSKYVHACQRSWLPGGPVKLAALSLGTAPHCYLTAGSTCPA